MINIFEHYAAGEKLYNKLITPVCEQYELTTMEFTILLFLANNPQFDTASHVVKYRHLTKSHVSISIRNLVERELVTGEYREQNRRSFHLSLTALAEPIIRDGRKAQEHFREVLFSGFSEEELEQLSQFVRRVDANMQAFEENTKAGESKS